MPRAAKADKNRQWDKHEIKAALGRMGKTLASIERENNLNKNDLSVSFNRPFEKADRVLSKALGVPLYEIWPDRYDADGNRIRYIQRRNRPTASSARRMERAAKALERAQMEVVQGGLA